MSYTRNPRSGISTLTLFNNWYNGCCSGSPEDVDCCIGNTLMTAQRYYNTLNVMGAIREKEVLNILAFEYLCFYLRYMKVLVIDDDPVKQKKLREQKIKEIQKMLECIKKNSCVIQRLPDVARVQNNSDNTVLDGGIYEDTYQPAINVITDQDPVVVLSTFPTNGVNPWGALGGAGRYILGDRANISWSKDESDPDNWMYDFWYWDTPTSNFAQYQEIIVQNQIETHVAYLRPGWRATVNYEIIPSDIPIPSATTEFPYAGFRLFIQAIHDGETFSEQHNIVGPSYTGSYSFNNLFSIGDFPSNGDRDQSTKFILNIPRANSTYHFNRPNSDCINPILERSISIDYTDADGNPLGSDLYEQDPNYPTILNSKDLSNQDHIDREVYIKITMPSTPETVNTKLVTEVAMPPEITLESGTVYNVNFNGYFYYEEEGSTVGMTTINRTNTHAWPNDSTNTPPWQSWYIKYFKDDIIDNLYFKIDHHQVEINGSNYDTDEIHYTKSNGGTEERIDRLINQSTKEVEIPKDDLVPISPNDMVKITQEITPQIYQFSRYCVIENAEGVKAAIPWYQFGVDIKFKDYDGNEIIDKHEHEIADTQEGASDNSLYNGLLESCKEVEFKAYISDDPVINDLLKDKITFDYYKVANYTVSTTPPSNLYKIPETPPADWTWEDGVTVPMYVIPQSGNSLRGVDTNVIIWNSINDLSSIPDLSERFTRIGYKYNFVIEGSSSNEVKIYNIPFFCEYNFEKHHIVRIEESGRTIRNSEWKSIDTGAYNNLQTTNFSNAMGIVAKFSAKMLPNSENTLNINRVYTTHNDGSTGFVTYSDSGQYTWYDNDEKSVLKFPYMVERPNDYPALYWPTFEIPENSMICYNVCVFYTDACRATNSSGNPISDSSYNGGYRIKSAALHNITLELSNSEFPQDMPNPILYSNKLKKDLSENSGNDSNPKVAIRIIRSATNKDTLKISIGEVTGYKTYISTLISDANLNYDDVMRLYNADQSFWFYETREISFSTRENTESGDGSYNNPYKVVILIDKIPE